MAAQFRVKVRPKNNVIPFPSSLKFTDITDALDEMTCPETEAVIIIASTGVWTEIRTFGGEKAVNSAIKAVFPEVEL